MSMKSGFGLAFAGAMFFAMAGLAQAADRVSPVVVSPVLPWDGYVSGAWGHLTLTGDALGSTTNSLSRASVRGSVATMLSPGFGVQADALGDFTASPDLSIGTANGAVHVYARSPSHLFGAFAQWRGLGLGSGGDASYLFGGVEGQWYVNRITLYGQAAAQQLSVNSGGTPTTGNGFLFNGQVRVLIHPNWRVDLLAGFDNINNVLGSNATTTQFGIGTEFRFNNPLSIFAQYIMSNSTTDTGSGGSKLFLLGAKLNIGTQTLAQRETMGASLDPVQGILLFIR